MEKRDPPMHRDNLPVVLPGNGWAGPTVLILGVDEAEWAKYASRLC